MRSSRRCNPLMSSIERRSRDRVEAGRRLVEEQELRVERERAGEAGALDHAARKLGRIFGASVGWKAAHRDLEGRDLVEQRRLG